jgi:hypothetical protein
MSVAIGACSRRRGGYAVCVCTLVLLAALVVAAPLLGAPGAGVDCRGRLVAERSKLSVCSLSNFMLLSSPLSLSFCSCVGDGG